MYFRHLPLPGRYHAQVKHDSRRFSEHVQIIKLHEFKANLFIRGDWASLQEQTKQVSDWQEHNYSMCTFLKSTERSQILPEQIVGESLFFRLLPLHLSELT